MSEDKDLVMTPQFRRWCIQQEYEGRARKKWFERRDKAIQYLKDNGWDYPESRLGERHKWKKYEAFEIYDLEPDDNGNPVRTAVQTFVFINEKEIRSPTIDECYECLKSNCPTSFAYWYEPDEWGVSRVALLRSLAEDEAHFFVLHLPEPKGIADLDIPEEWHYQSHSNRNPNGRLLPSIQRMKDTGYWEMLDDHAKEVILKAEADGNTEGSNSVRKD